MLKFFHSKLKFIIITLFAALFLIIISLLYYNSDQQTYLKNKQVSFQQLQLSQASLSAQLSKFQKRDEYLINAQLEKEIDDIQKTFKNASTTYEDLVELKAKAKDISKLDKLFANILALLSQRNYASASASTEELNKQIKSEDEKITSSFKIPQNVPIQNTPPQVGHRRQQVQLDIGSYLVDIVSADLNSTRVIVDTASDSDCSNNCPVLSLADYVSRNSAFAGINGSYFCPEQYPSCTGKTNSFDTLLMNKNKKYFNSDNNVYSTVPAVIFSGSSARFVGQSLEWGRDTGIDAVIANYPLLVSGGQVVFGGNSDPKQGSKGARSFVAASGTTAYIGVVHNATVAEVARVLVGLGIQNALNLDSGGSVALWYSGYKTGPGRNIPNALLFVKK